MTDRVLITDLPDYLDRHGLRVEGWDPHDPHTLLLVPDPDRRTVGAGCTWERVAPAISSIGLSLTEAQAVAAEIHAALAPTCARIEVAGSVRRGKPAGIKDIEIVAISAPAGRPAFGQKEVRPLHALTDNLLAQGKLEHRPDKHGRHAWGALYRRAVWNSPELGRVALDLFITDAEGWGVQFTLRTGNADFSHALVTERGKLGQTPDGHTVPGLLPVGMKVQGGRIRSHNGVALPTPEESDVFKALGLPHVAPGDRDMSMVVRLVRGKR